MKFKKQKEQYIYIHKNIYNSKLQLIINLLSHTITRLNIKKRLLLKTIIMH